MAGTSMSWTEVVTMGESRVPYGVSDEGRWGILNREGQWEELHPRVSPSLVTVVQEEPDAFFARLREGILRAGLDPALAQTFPVRYSILMGLTWSSDFWQAHALKWVQARGEARVFIVELRELAGRGETQAIRHLARRLARRAERETASRSSG